MYVTWPTESRRASRVIASWMSDSASGPRTSHLRRGERSITATLSRQAQYSAIAPSLSKQCGSQKPRYSTKLFVSALVRGWNVVSRVRTGSASAVTRRAIAVENVLSGAYTRTWTGVICQPFAASMSSGQADDAHRRSVIARRST